MMTKITSVSALHEKNTQNYQFQTVLMTLIETIEVVLDDGCAKLQRKIYQLRMNDQISQIGSPFSFLLRSPSGNLTNEQGV